MIVNANVLSGSYDRFNSHRVGRLAENYRNSHTNSARTGLGDDIIARVAIAPTQGNIKLANIALEKLGDKRRV